MGVAVPPNVTVTSSSSVPLREGTDSVTLTCSADSVPPPTYIWVRAGGQGEVGRGPQLTIRHRVTSTPRLAVFYQYLGGTQFLAGYDVTGLLTALWTGRTRTATPALPATVSAPAAPSLSVWMSTVSSYQNFGSISTKLALLSTNHIFLPSLKMDGADCRNIYPQLCPT